MKLRDFYKILGADPDLNLDAVLVVDLYSCCGVQDSIEVQETRVENDEDFIRIEVNAGSCREYGNKTRCKNFEILNLILEELKEAGQLTLLLTSKNERLRKYAEDRFR